jgi:hypothetical protein
MHCFPLIENVYSQYYYLYLYICLWFIYLGFKPHVDQLLQRILLRLRVSEFTVKRSRLSLKLEKRHNK